MIKKLSPLSTWLVAGLLWSCDQETTVDLGTPEQRLVVEGRIELRADALSSMQTINLSTVGDFFENEPTPRATGAAVWITDTEGHLYDFEESAPGQYVNDDLRAAANRHYTLHIIWEDQEFEAVESLAPVAPIDAIYQQFEEGNLFEDEGIKIAIDFTDPLGSEDYYFWETYLDGVLQILPDPGNKNNIIATDEFFDGNQIEGYFPNEEIVFEAGDEVRVQQIGLSENAYQYYFTLLDQAGKTGTLIDTPPIPVRGNIRNLTDPDRYALGYFYISEIAEGFHIIE